MAARSGRTRTIDVGTLARVEGEGALHVKVARGRVSDVKLRIYEPPRFFEGFLRGRRFSEAPDITARVCGICPIAYQMSAVQAIEDALGLAVDPRVRALRRLIYCGEWIESHALHIFMLHAPDFLGYEDAIRMAADHRDVVTRALEIKKAGNALVGVIGGREIHPINVRVGGFYRAPRRDELDALVDRLERARDLSAGAVRWTATLSMPVFEADYEFVALRHPSDYPITEGRLASSSGLDIDIQDWDTAFVEQHLEHSHALHCALKGRGAYVVGPLARYCLNFDRLPPVAQDAARAAGLGRVCRNPFQSIIVRAVELLFACEEALRLIHRYEPPDPPAMDVTPRAGTGHGCTEAPRGVLYHRYALADDGSIQDACIIPPTSQNQKSIESDLRLFVQQHLDLPDATLQWQCEQAIRNYDPCISCATHFLRLEIDRTG
jgi:coenzyme F420-reducing hydrogenase alpha subunit